MQTGRGGEDVVERIGSVRELGELEGVVVPREIDAVRRELFLVAGEFGPELFPAGRVIGPLVLTQLPAR